MANKNYQCFNCGKRFDQLLRVDTLNVFTQVCPHCKSYNYANLLGLDEVMPDLVKENDLVEIPLKRKPGPVVPGCDCNDCSVIREAAKSHSIDSEEPTIKEDEAAIRKRLYSLMSSEQQEIGRLNSRIEELKNLLGDWEVYCDELKKVTIVKNTDEDKTDEDKDDIGIDTSWYEEIFQERERQKEIGNSEFDDSNTRNDWAAYICRYVSQGAYDGHGEFTLEGFRTALVKAAALCVAAIEAIDRNKMLTLPEYDLLMMREASKVLSEQRVREIKETEERIEKENIAAKKLCEKLFGETKAGKIKGMERITVCACPEFLQESWCGDCSYQKFCDADPNRKVFEESKPKPGKIQMMDITVCPHIEFRMQHGCTGCAMFRYCDAKDKP